MACNQETRTIQDNEGNDHTYMVTQLSAKAALFLKLRLMKALAPGLKRLKDIVGSIGTEEGASEQTSDQKQKAVGSMLEGISAILQNMEPVEGVALIEQILTGGGLVHRDGAKLTSIDLAYTGDLGEMYKAVLFVLEVNYKDFFVVLEKLKPTSTAPQTQTS